MRQGGRALAAPNIYTYEAGSTMEVEVSGVKLPNKPCDSCTLQIIQVMTESFRAPYDPEATRSNDIYSTCIDLVLTTAGVGGWRGRRWWRSGERRGSVAERSGW